MPRGEQRRQVLADLHRARLERDVARAALAQRDAALTLVREDLLRAAAGGRLADPRDLWRYGIAAAVIGADGTVDLVLLEQRIVQLLAEHPDIAAVGG